MTAEITRLANGLTVVTETAPHLETSALGVWVDAGARHERDDEHGLSHLLEHMAFKGTATRSTQDIAEEIEAVGGELNAATGLETTAYFARVLKGDEGLALGIVADILQNSTFADEELEKEREVILQEIAGTLDSPDDLAFDLVHDAAFPDQPAGRTILGTPKSVKSISRNKLKDFLAERYHPKGMVLAGAGAIRHEDAVCHAQALFGGLSNAGPGAESPAVYRGGVRSSPRKFEQAHLILGFEAPSYREEEFFASQVLSGLLGGGMSSRLFQEVRERRGLCYAIYSTAWGLKDTGLFAVHAATGAGMVGELIDVVSDEIDRMAETGPTEPEVARAKAQLKAGLMMSLESSSARAEQMARQMLLHGRVLTTAEILASVDKVSAAEVTAVAQRLRAKGSSIAVVGAGRKSDDLATRAGQRLKRAG
ncbi:MAG: peptidase M16 [Hyphomicrobium sp. 32-62-53]|nr:MAG: peptidase M16 [Hyphomicrobium sp. 12-62-95]OYX99375.1 MAG: peptidase M16 [Hyphomicrobium sp. 32-62-53]